MIRSSWWSIIIILSAIAMILAVVSGIETPARPLITFWFMLVCPGMAFVRLLRIEERFAELILAIALSIALDTIVAEAMVLNRLWSPKWGLFVLICLSLVGAGLQIIQAFSQLMDARRQALSEQ